MYRCIQIDITFIFTLTSPNLAATIRSDTFRIPDVALMLGRMTTEFKVTQTARVRSWDDARALAVSFERAGARASFQLLAA